VRVWSRRLLKGAVVVLALAAGRAAEGQYLAVFVDGRILPVKSVRLLDDGGRVRLELGEGGRIDIPIGRFDRIIEDAVEVEPKPIPHPPCRTGFAEAPLPEGARFQREIAGAAREANLHPRLVAAVVEVESGYNRWAVSRVGARGLMQLMPSVWTEQGVADPHDAAANLRAGARHLAGLLDRFGDLTLALAAYNAGAATVEREGGVPPYRETRDYVRKVLARFCAPAPEAGSAASPR
jgi:hypothetical protein